MFYLFAVNMLKWVFNLKQKYFKCYFYRNIKYFDKYSRTIHGMLLLPNIIVVVRQMISLSLGYLQDVDVALSEKVAQF